MAGGPGPNVGGRAAAVPVRVVNRQDFRGLDRFRVDWRVLEDGVAVQEGWLPAPDVPPGDTAILQVPVREPTPVPGAEYVLDLSFITLEDEPLIPAGHEAVFGQVALPWGRVIADAAADRPRGVVTPAPVEPRARGALPPLEVSRGAEAVRITGQGFAATFDPATGLLTSYARGDRELLLTGPRPDFWRAPTDNDFGGDWQKKLAVWRSAGEGFRVESVDVERSADGAVRVTARGAIPAGATRYVLSQEVRGDGVVVFDAHLLPGDDSLPMLPRVGMVLTLPAALDRAEWYGRGPHEAYWDRKTGARLGRWRSTVDSLYHPYVRPQESGQRADVRWMTLTDGAGYGLLLTGEAPLDVTASRFLSQDLDEGEEKRNRHDVELVPRDLVRLNVDFRQMGVGGVTSWGPTAIPEYQLPYGEYRYRWALRGIGPEDEPAVIARTLP